jgi:hypothetical protein
MPLLAEINPSTAFQRALVAGTRHVPLPFQEHQRRTYDDEGINQALEALQKN